MGLFNGYMKPGKGLSKEDLDKSGIALYLDIFGRRFWKLMTINLMYLIASIPAIIIASFIALYFMQVVLGIVGWGITEQGFSEGAISAMRYLSVPFIVIILQVTGSGPASVAKDYMIRKYVKDTHVWMWSDFVSAFKKNFWQGMAVYIINTIVFVLLFFAFLYYYFIMKSTLLSVVITMLSVIFFIMQKYVYVLVSGFKLKIKHIYRNAALLSIVGLGWNILSSIFVLAIMFAVGTLYSSYPGISFAIILALYFSIISFTQIFLTRHVVGKYLEEPALQQEKDENPDKNQDDWD